MSVDLGSGVGNNILTVLQFTHKVTAVDASADALKYSKKRHRGCNISYLQADIENLPFPSASFDLVVCTEVIEHVNSIEQVCAEVWRILKPNGYCILSGQSYCNLAGVTKLFFEMVLGKKDWDVWGDSEGHRENWITSYKIEGILKKYRWKKVKENGADYFNAWFAWIPFVYRNYKFLDKHPIFTLGKIPFIRRFGMDYFWLLQKV